MPSRPGRKRRILKRALATGLILSTLGAGALVLLWNRGTLKHWLQAKIVEIYLRKVEPHLPFRIEGLEVDSSWREALEGRISRLSTVIRWGDWRIRLAGPIDINRPSKERDSYSVHFAPVATIEPAPSFGEAPIALRSTPLPLVLDLRAAHDLKGLQALTLSAGAGAFAWKPLDLELKSLALRAEWDGARAVVRLAAGELAWNAAADRMVQAKEVSLDARAALALKPFSVGPRVEAEARGRSAEVLLGETYLDLPLSSLPLKASLELGGEGGLEPRSAELEIGEASGKSPAPARLSASRSEVRWRLAALPVREALESLKAATGGGMGPFAFLTKLAAFDIRAGRVSSEGRAAVNLFAAIPSALPRAEGTLRLEGGALQWPGAAFAARGIRADLPFSTRNGLQGIVSVDEVYFRKLRARLSPLNVSVEALGKDVLAPEGLRVRAGGTTRGGASGIPLAIEGVPLSLGPVAGRVRPAARDESQRFELESSARLAETPAEPLIRSLCLSRGRVPPATVSADLPYVEIGPGSIDPQGEITAKLFNGAMRVSNFGIFDLGSDEPTAPEIDFDLDFDGIRLGQLGAWSGFGDMKGYLKGHARDVVIRGGMPAHFDFSIDAMPAGTWIEFSPQAMNNLVNLFAREAVQELPEIAKETFFGWVSGRLGGYDVKYAGLSLYSQDGTTLLSTHDQADIYWAFKKHFIIWGRRFKMPLNSSQYPVVVDQTAMGIYARGMIDYLSALSRQKAESENLSKENANDPVPKSDEDPDCHPPSF